MLKYVLLAACALSTGANAALTLENAAECNHMERFSLKEIELDGMNASTLRSVKVIAPKSMPYYTLTIDNSDQDNAEVVVETERMQGDVSIVPKIVDGKVVVDLSEFDDKKYNKNCFVVDDDEKELLTNKMRVTIKMPTDTCWRKDRDDEDQVHLVDGDRCVRVLHVNDFHSYVQGTKGGSCDPTKEACDGGWGKLFTVVKDLAAAAPGRTLFIDDGDQFMGTLWSKIYKGEESVRFLNKLCEDETNMKCFATLGNHEFDYGYDPVVDYTRNLTFPIINNNIDDSTCEGDRGMRLLNNDTVSVGKYNVGLTGYITPSTKDISSAPDCVQFNHLVNSTSPIVSGLKAQGDVDIVVALSHSGYDVDMEMAATMEEDSRPDVIIGGHTHTFLWNERELGAEPESDAIKYMPSTGGEYTTIVNGTHIVQASAFSVFLGGFDIIFDAGGYYTITPIIRHIRGFEAGKYNSEIVEIPDHPDAKELIESMVDEVEELGGETVGVIGKDLSGGSSVRNIQNEVGSLVADAIVWKMKGDKNTDFGGPVDFALMNSGGVRTPLNVGDVTYGDVIGVLPFGNSIGVVKLTGHQFYLAMEHGLSVLPKGGGALPQISGFIVEYDLDTEASCGKGTEVTCTSELLPVRVHTIRREDNDEVVPNTADSSVLLATNDFLLGGGDSYKILGEGDILLTTGPLLDDAFAGFLKESTELLADYKMPARLVNKKPSSGFSTGEIVGVTVGSLLIVGAILAFFFGTASDEVEVNNGEASADNPEFV